MRFDKSHSRRIGEKKRESGMIRLAIEVVDDRAREREKS